MSSTKNDLNRGTYSQPVYSKSVTVRRSSLKEPDIDLNAMFEDSQNEGKRMLLFIESSGKPIKREIQYSIKKELQRSFYEQVNKLLE